MKYNGNITGKAVVNKFSGKHGIVVDGWQRETGNMVGRCIVMFEGDSFQYGGVKIDRSDLIEVTFADWRVK